MIENFLDQTLKKKKKKLFFEVSTFFLRKFFEPNPKKKKKKVSTFFFEEIFIFWGQSQKGLKFSKKSSKMTALFSRQKIPQNDCFVLKTKNTPKRLFCPEGKKYPKTTFNFGGDFSKKKNGNKTTVGNRKN